MLQRLEDPHIMPGLMFSPYCLRKSLMYILLMFLKKWVCCQYRDQTGGCVVSTGTKQVGVLSVQGPNRWVCCQYRDQAGGCVVSTGTKQVGVLSVQGPKR